MSNRENNVVRLPDYERRSRNPDAVYRDPADSAVIIILPVVRIERVNLKAGESR